uniref:Uncharacterized protein n=1 Tax=Brassica oleracea TaxID=3712 RepID=A0A3P6B291_BRAOL|nr:unnamed protein product [Brassica oleracea]
MGGLVQGGSTPRGLQLISCSNCLLCSTIGSISVYQMVSHVDSGLITGPPLAA